MAGVSAGPLLTDAAQFDRLEGTGRFEVAIAARGRSQRAMVQALNGSGAVTFNDGAIRGINLAAMARNVKGAFLKGGSDETQKTDFAELSGTFTIDKGILTNNDLKLLNPLLRVTGAGTADMPQKTLDYRLRPKLVGSLEGQGAEVEATGITVPILVVGPWHDPDIKLDTAAAIGDVVKDPGKALKGAKDTVKGAKDTLKGLTKPPAEGGESTLPDPGKALKKLFGN
jgi:AsmA protein